MSQKTSFVPKFRKGDIDAAIGTFFDGFSKVLVGVAVLGGIMPGELYGTILPGLVLTIFIWGIWTYIQAQKVQNRTGKSVTALPGGINAGRFFIWLFAIIMPTFDATGDAILAIKAGIGSNLIGAAIFLVMVPIIEKVLKVVPKPAIFAGLAGGAIAFLMLSPMTQGYDHPEVFMATFFILLVFQFGKFNVKFSPSSVAIIVGIIVGWALGYMNVDSITEAFSTVGFYAPHPALGFLPGCFSAAVPFLPVVIAFSFTDVLSAIQAVEQGLGEGDDYKIRESIFAGGIINVIGSLLGNPFPVGYYFGHPAWKRVGAGTAFPVMYASIYLILGCSGLIAIASAIIPTAAALPLLVFAAMATVGQAFEINEKKYYVAMALGTGIPIFEWAIGLSAEPTSGLVALGKGSMLIAILYTYIVCTIIDRKFISGGVCFALMAVLSAFGLMHMPDVTFPPVFNNYVGVYLIAAVAFIILGKFVKSEPAKQEVEE